MKKMSIYILAIFLAAGIFILAGCSSGTEGGGGTLSNIVDGTVVDTQNYSISGINCTLTSALGGTQTTVSDSNGNFSFSNVGEGDYNVLCDQAGYITSRYHINVTANGANYRGTTNVKMVVLTPSEFDSFAGADHLYDYNLGYIMPLVVNSSGQEMAGVSFYSQPGAMATGYVGAGIDWNATSTFANQGRALLEVAPGPSYSVTASMSGTSFNPESIDITPQQGELTLIQFQAQ